VVHASLPSRRRLVRGGAPRQSPTALLTVIGPDKTGPSGLYCFGQRLTVHVHFVWQHHALWFYPTFEGVFAGRQFHVVKLASNITSSPQLGLAIDAIYAFTQRHPLAFGHLPLHKFKMLFTKMV
jgi:hypothetical protein